MPFRVPHSLRWIPVLIAIAFATVAATAPGVSPEHRSWDAWLLPSGIEHPRLIIQGRVLDEAGRPKRGARLLVHQAAPTGTVCYPDDRSLMRIGSLRTNVLGQFEVDTQIPGMAEGIPHIHFELETPGEPVRAIALRLARCEAAGSDTDFARLPFVDRVSDPTYWAQVTRDTAGDYHAHWDLRMAKLIALPDSISARVR